jgi:hypothetical protein
MSICSERSAAGGYSVFLDSVGMKLSVFTHEQAILFVLVLRPWSSSFSNILTFILNSTGQKIEFAQSFRSINLMQI